MGTALTNLQRKDTYKDLLHLDHDNAGVDLTLRRLVDGGGGDSALHVSSKEIGIGSLGTAETGLRMASEHASACYWVTVDKAEFNGTPDYVSIWGWNTAYVGGYNVVAGEPSLSVQMESNYDTGTDNWMEWFVAYHPDTGSGPNSRRPFQCAVNRSNHECWNTITGRTSIHDNDGTQNLVINADGSVNLIRAYIQHVTNNTQILKQMNAESDALLNVVFLDGLNRTHCEPVYSEGAVWLKTAALPADGSINAGECAMIFDDTNLAAKVQWKGKTADGTVVTGEVSLT